MITQRQAPLSVFGSTHASSVIRFVSCNEAEFATVTQLDDPSNESAPPNLPTLAHVVLVSVPVLPLPDASAVVVPLPSLNPYAATSPLGGAVTAAVAWFEDALRAMRDTGLREAEKASIVMMLSGYVTNHVTVMTQVEQGFLAGDAPDAAMRGYADALRRLADRDRFPALHAVLDAGVFDRADPPDEEFAFGLERILDGIEALVTRRSRS
jgi:hypothetical protein